MLLFTRRRLRSGLRPLALFLGLVLGHFLPPLLLLSLSILIGLLLLVRLLLAVLTLLGLLLLFLFLIV